MATFELLRGIFYDLVDQANECKCIASLSQSLADTLIWLEAAEALFNESSMVYMEMVKLMNGDQNAD